MRWIILMLGVVLMLPAAAQTREVVWERWDVDIFDDLSTNCLMTATLRTEGYDP